MIRGNPKTIHHIFYPLSSLKIFSRINLKKKVKKTPNAIKNWFKAPSVPEI